MKNRIGKIISLLLSLMIIVTAITALPVSAQAAETDTQSVGASSGATGDCTWTLDNGVLTISGNGRMEDYNYFSDSKAPWGTDIIQVIISNGVTNVGAHAFNGCENLSCFTLADSVTTIGVSAFDGCSKLKSITIPAGVTKIVGNTVFSGCTGLESITVDKRNTVYDSRNDCNGIIDTSRNELIKACNTTVIPNSVTSIGGGAFSGCTKITSLTISDNITSIGDYAFFGCTGFSGITLPDSITIIGSYAFSRCTGLESITIPGSVTEIGYNAFSECTALSNVTICDGQRYRYRECCVLRL